MNVPVNVQTGRTTPLGGLCSKYAGMPLAVVYSLDFFLCNHLPSASDWRVLLCSKGPGCLQDVSALRSYQRDFMVSSYGLNRRNIHEYLNSRMFVGCSEHLAPGNCKFLRVWEGFAALQASDGLWGLCSLLLIPLS